MLSMFCLVNFSPQICTGDHITLTTKEGKKLKLFCSLHLPECRSVILIVYPFALLPGRYERPCVLGHEDGYITELR